MQAKELSRFPCGSSPTTANRAELQRCPSLPLHKLPSPLLVEHKRVSLTCYSSGQPRMPVDLQIRFHNPRRPPCFNYDQAVNAATKTFHPNPQKRVSVRSSAHSAHHVQRHFLAEHVRTAAANCFPAHAARRVNSRSFLHRQNVSTYLQVAAGQPELAVNRGFAIARSPVQIKLKPFGLIRPKLLFSPKRCTSLWP